MQFFVTATDTNVGKTEVAAALLRLMVDAGLGPFAFKPYESGVARLDAPSDAMRLRAAAGGVQPLSTVSLYRFKKPLAPGIASRLERKPTSWSKTLAAHRAFGAERSGVIEGAGGLFVPLDAKHDVIHLIDALNAPVVLVARSGLGTLNHTLLSLEALFSRGLRVAAVVLNSATAASDASVPYNRDELRRRFPKLPVLGPTRFQPNVKNRDTMLRRELTPLVFYRRAAGRR